MEKQASNPPLPMSVMWALAGAGAGGLIGGMRKPKKKDSRFKRMLSGALIGGGSGYLANKGISNYIANNFGQQPENYELSNVLQQLKPKSLRQVAHDVSNRPNLETLKARHSPMANHSIKRAELLARGLGVFDDSKGSDFRGITAETRKNLAPSIQKLIAGIPTEKLIEFKDDKSLDEVLSHSSYGNADKIKSFMNSLSTPEVSLKNNNVDVLGKHSVILGRPFKRNPGFSSLSFADTWDVGRNKGDKLFNAPKKISLKEYLRSGDGVLKDQIKKLLTGSKSTVSGGWSILDKPGVNWPNVSRALLDNLLLDPVTVTGSKRY